MTDLRAAPDPRARINDQNHYVLCDFGSATQKVLEPDKIGVARVEDEITRFTTVQYRSPEMVDLYSGYPIGLKADIWALGVLLYHLCFFQLPFNTQLAIQTGEVAVPDGSSFSSDLHKVIRLCLQTNPKDRPDIWQLSGAIFGIMKKPNPIDNVHQLEPIDLARVDPLPTSTQLAQMKQQQQHQQPPPASAATVAPAVAAAVPRHAPKSDNPQQLVDKADEALSILKGQMEQIKLKYDANSDPSEKGRLEAQALTIKVFCYFNKKKSSNLFFKSNYLKIQEVRRTNVSKIMNCSKMSSSPSLPNTSTNTTTTTNIMPCAPFPINGDMGSNSNSSRSRESRSNHLAISHQLDLTHRRAISDPSSIDTILNYRKSENGDYIILICFFCMIYFFLIFLKIIFSAEWSNIDQQHFGSDSTIDSQATVCPLPSAQHDDDQGVCVLLLR